MICSKWLLLLSLVIFIGACTSPEAEELELPEHIRELENLTAYPADVEPLNTIMLTPNGSYETNEDVLMGIIEDIQVDDRGRVFLEDGQQVVFHIINPDGSYLTGLGREGRGPGEFLGRSVLKHKIALNRLYVFDSLLSRISVFDLETLSIFHTIDLNPTEWSQGENLSIGAGSEFYVQNDSTILLEASSNVDPYNAPPKYHYFYINNSGERVSDIVFQQEDTEPISYQFQGQRLVTGFIYQEEPLFTMTADSRLIAARTGDFLINIYQSDGEHLEAIYYQFEKQPLSRDELIEHYDLGFEYPGISAIRSIELPEFWPALDNMIVDDENRLWVSTIVEGREVYEWWVLDLDRQGELLARFEWPRSRSIEVIKNGFVYTMERNEESGIRHVTRYRIEMTER